MAGPAAGKSTLAAFIFTSLKAKGLSIELVQEYVKTWTYLDQKPQSFDQLYLFAKQCHKEDVILRSGVKLVVSDCPLILPCFYAYYNRLPGWNHLYSLDREFEHQYPSINFFIKRSEKGYDKVGRFHTEEQAKDIDRQLEGLLIAKYKQSLFSFEFDEQDKILKKILEIIDIKQVKEDFILYQKP